LTSICDNEMMVEIASDLKINHECVDTKREEGKL